VRRSIREFSSFRLSISRFLLLVRVRAVARSHAPTLSGIEESLSPSSGRGNHSR
jgi:hypothetical protein